MIWLYLVCFLHEENITTFKALAINSNTYPLGIIKKLSQKFTAGFVSMGLSNGDRISSALRISEITINWGSTI